MSQMRPTKRRRPNPPRDPPPQRRYRRVVPKPDPFGFPLGPVISNLTAPGALGTSAHNIQNYIKGFRDGLPVFHKPNQVYHIEKVNGIYASVTGRTEPILISKLHTDYTVHLYHEAHGILGQIKIQPRVSLVHVAADDFKVVDISQATYNRRQNDRNMVYLNAKHMGKTVVLKTTTDPSTMLKYVLEAVIHLHLSHKAPHCVPALHFIGMAAGNRLVVCSEQLRTPSVASWTQTLQRRPDNSRALYFMLKNVCNAFAVIQRTARFTHRDAHTSNVYYNEKTRQIKFIDFDWSCIRVGGRILSVPRYLYDTTRATYGKNRSVDLCIFMRCLGNQLKNAPAFINEIWLPLMRRYERESGQILLHKMAGKDGAGEVTAAKQLYKMGFGKRNGRRGYSHVTAYKRYKKEFDYQMGYFEWPCMTPTAILQFLSEHNITRR